VTSDGNVGVGLPVGVGCWVDVGDADGEVDAIVGFEEDVPGVGVRVLTAGRVTVILSNECAISLLAGVELLVSGCPSEELKDPCWQLLVAISIR
jgi:hypothetical protein